MLAAALATAPAISFAQAAPAQVKNPIVKREFNQQRRIGNAIRRHSLTPRQGARLERQQVRMHRQIRSMRARHNGRTMHERRMIHRKQMIASRRIYRASHMHRIG